jgi:hypothetical protein
MRMSDHAYIEVHGCRFEVQHRGFDDHPMDLNAGMTEVDRILMAMDPRLVKTIHAKAKAAEDDMAGTGITEDISKLESIAFRRATKNWTGDKDAYIWLRAV